MFNITCDHVSSILQTKPFFFPHKRAILITLDFQTKICTDLWFKESHCNEIRRLRTPSVFKLGGQARTEEIILRFVKKIITVCFLFLSAQGKINAVSIVFVE